MSAQIRKGVVTPQGVAMPEWLSRKDSEAGSWTVEEGQATRGNAWTNRMDRLMRVPFGPDDLSRAVRAHEMMHAKVSPESAHFADRMDVSSEAIIVAEEFRVNQLCSAVGFDMDALRDGSESNTGKRLAQNKDWNNLVLMICATAGTKACKDMIRGVGTVDKALADKAKVVEKSVVDQWKSERRRYGALRDPRSLKRLAQVVGDTTPYVFGPDGVQKRSYHKGDSLTPDEMVLPLGLYFTMRLAGQIDAMLRYDDDVADAEVSMEDGIPTDEELEGMAKSGGRDNWARLIVDRSVPLTRRAKGNLGRRRIATNIGVAPRRMERLLTDPDKRVFDRTLKGQGGVILIDQSGSMSLTDDDVMALVDEAPGCVVIGYSHRPGSSGVPNVWILADRGKVCARVRRGNGGNGVDGPALVFANKLRKKGEPLVWVCDGSVTTSDDRHAPAPLQKQVVSFVRKHSVHMVASVEEAVTALRKAKAGNRLTTRIVGPLNEYK